MKAFFDLLPSTNVYAKQNILSLQHKDIIIARRQTAGRGRNQRIWLSDTGGLYFSLILKPPYINVTFLNSLTQAMALAVCKTAKERGIEAYIKWPNDVLANGRKFCGILSEAVFTDNALTAVIIGTGINISQADIPSDKPAVTLKNLGLDIQEEALLDLVISNFYFYFGRIAEGGFKAIRADYKANFPYTGKESAIKTGTEEIKGIITDIDEEGRLIVGGRAISIGDMDF